jgi:probable HAF family extracellular repeat protein
MLLDASGPKDVRTDSLGYVYDAEGRLIAREIAESDPKRFAVDDKVAKAQFEELAAEAVLYTASMIKHVIDIGGVKLCAPLLSERYRAVMMPIAPPTHLNGVSENIPSSINAAGHIAGIIGRPFSMHGVFLWNGPTATRFDTLRPAEPPILNDHGSFAVTIGEPSFSSIGLWNGTSLLGIGGGWAIDFNNSGVILGGSTLATGEQRFFRWSGSFEPIPLGPPGSREFAGAINDFGHVCGGYSTGTGAATTSFATIWDGRSPPRTLPGTPRGVPWGAFRCEDLTNDGKAVGAATNESAGGIGYLWTGSAFVDLGGLGGFSTLPHALNDLGVVVGQAATPFPTEHFRGFVWKNGTMRDLNDLIDWPESGWFISAAFGINNLGQIVGVATDKDNLNLSLTARYRTVRLDPIR